MEVTQRFGHVAFFEAHGEDENFVHEQVRFFEGDFQFLVAVAVLFVERPRQADDDRVASEDCLADFALPVLPGLELLGVEPRINSIPD